MPDPDPAAARPFRHTTSRAWRLWRGFKLEQTDPAAFYGLLAQDSVAHVSAFLPDGLDGRWVLDVGGGPGYFADAFTGAGARYTALDSDVGELSGLGSLQPGTVIGSGMQLPFADGSFDVVYSSNVLEHVPEPWVMADELVRVARPGGLVFCSYTLWFGPHGGHETSPWHLVLGGHRARRRYERKHGHPPKNVYGESMFPAKAAPGIRWARGRADVELLSLAPRYLPRWAHWVVRVPLLREAVTWNLAIVMRKH
ncbi:bifunctional 2-polyprenyl-6-hydroxyphenol methylase/3-demethylubiquinol 3-O-methyltransferase UbiG [Aeromicrobium sp. Leaf350]|uniref:class I SAM-dependent methyltransferase n=1 Tax=Aeromicrobium sp. Leaf350 TaxID=2876565 RepID=UPI001E65AD84|nr:class I SAM-dependent methyltransferase [Aeromicrobium sp. Leaf350]